MFARVIRSKKEFNNLMATNGRGWKAIQVGEKHHVAWQFPTLVTSPNAEVMYPVDCLHLPVVFDLDASLDNESVLDDSVLSDVSVYIDQFVEQMDEVRESNNEFIYDGGHCICHFMIISHLVM